MENTQVRNLIKKLKAFAKQKNKDAFNGFTTQVINDHLLSEALNISSKKELLTTINTICLYFGDFERDEDVLSQLLDTERKKTSPNQDYIAFIINYLGELYYYKSDFERALNHYQEALDIRVHLYGETHPDTVECYSNLAMINTELGRFHEAEELFTQASKAYESRISGHIEEYIKTIWNNGLMYQYWGKYSLAMERYLTALEISQLNATKELTDDIENNLGVLYLETGNYQAAEEYLEKTADYSLKHYGINHPKTIITLNNLCSAQMNLGKMDKAKQGFSKLQAVPKTKLPMIALKIAINRAVYYIKTGETHQALKILEQSLEESINWDVQIKILSHMAKIHLIQKAPQIALDRVKEALSLQETKIGKKHIQYTRLLGVLGQIHICLNKKDTAFENLIQSTELQNDLLLQVSSSFSKDYAWNFLQKINSEQNQLLSLFFILQQEKGMDNTIIQQYILDIYQILLRRKAVVFDAGVERYHQILKKGDPQLKKRFNQLVSIKEEIVLRTTKGFYSDSPEENQKKVKALTSKAEILENRFSTTVPIYSYTHKTKQATLDLLKNKIPENALFVDIFKFQFVDFYDPQQTTKKTGYLIFYLNKNITDFLFIEDADAIEKLIQQTDSTHNQLNRGVQNHSKNGHHHMTPEEALSKLWERLFEANDTLRQPLIDTLCISPDGEFFNLPFESLICKNGQYLIENYRVQYLSSGRQLINDTNEDKANNDSIRIFADPSFEIENGLKTIDNNEAGKIKHTVFRNEVSEFPPLPGTISEAEEIITVFKRHHVPTFSLSTGETVNDSEVKKINSPCILHFATHGFYLEKRVDIHPFSRCGIALSGINNILKGQWIPSLYEDGMLTGMDILSINLIDTDLVVLSACKTGRGQIAPGEGVMGLCSAFISSGAASVMVSLWNVPDVFTVRLMASFYEHLAWGMTKSEALKRSKKDMIQTLREQWGEAPSWIWGGFILYGDDSPIRNFNEASLENNPLHGEMI